MAQTSVFRPAEGEPVISEFPHPHRTDTDAVSSARMIISKVGLWSAGLSALFSALYGLAAIAVLIASLSALPSSQPQGWTGIDSYLVVFQPVGMLPVIPSLFLVPAFTALMVSIDAYVSEEKKIWSRLGLAFTLIYASLAAANYLIQLLPVWRSIRSGETDGLAMFVMGNPHSIFWALAYAYIFMNLAMLLCAPVFGGNRLEKRIRLLFLLNGASAVVTIGSIFFDSPQIYLLGSLIVWCPLFVAAVSAVGILFRNTIRAEH